MTSDRILRKIERCLALSGSTNEHEAGIALRQAQRLMVEYGISDSDIAASAIERCVVRAEAGHKPPKWLGRLASLVNAAFGTVAVYEPRPALSGWQGYYAFLGPASQVRIAAYAFEALQRQLISDRQAFLITMSRRAKRTTKTRRADAYASAWVSGAYAHIVPVETPSVRRSDAATEAINHFKKRVYTTLDDLCAIDRGQRRDDHKAMVKGYEAGRNVRLHSGIEQARQEELTHG